MGDSILTRGLTESVLFAPKPRAEGSSPSAPAKILMFVIGQKGLKAPFFGAFLLFIGTFLVKFSYKENKTKIE